MLTRYRSGAIRFLFFVLLTAAVGLLGGCAHQPTPETFDPPGFWYGLLHGFLILFSFIGSLFTDVRLYAFPNSGRWYDFGYVIGVYAFFSPFAAFSRPRPIPASESDIEDCENGYVKLYRF